MLENELHDHTLLLSGSQVFSFQGNCMRMEVNPTRCYQQNDLEIFNVLQHPVWVFDIEKKSMFWSNKEGLKIWNAESLEELLARNFADDLTEATARRMQDQLNRLSRGEIIKESWTAYPSGRGATTMRYTASAIRIDGGRVAALVEAEIPGSREIDQSATRGVEILRHLPLAVCQFDIEGNLVYQNPEAFSVFGTPEVGETGTFLARFVDKVVGKAVLEKVREGHDYNVEAENYTNGGPKWFNISVRKSRDPVSSESRILYSARDISEIKEARKEASDAHLKSEFMAVMAHEIRTPLHQIVGYTDLLGLTDLSQEQYEQVKMINNASGLLMAIINDLLDYTKLENGKLLLENICFDPTGVLGCCIAAIEAQAREKGLLVRSILADDLPRHLIGDPNRIRQILLNLLQNSIKFTDQGSITLTVSIVKTDPHQTSPVRVRFEIADTGVGIDPSRQAIVFEKYQQAHASVARNYGGTGLGLAICKSLSENMGGSISLESEVGKGTTLIVEIPFELPDSEASERCAKRAKAEGRASAIDSTDKTALRVLVAEDNKVSQKMVISMLQRMGHHVTIADNGQMAVDVCKTTDFDLVLMDVQMPVLDGVAATKQIRTSGRTKASLPVIGLTASYEHRDLQFYLDAGMNDCLGKPVKLHMLKKVIQKTILVPAGSKITSHVTVVAS